MENLIEPVPYTLPLSFLSDRVERIEGARVQSPSFDDLCRNFFGTDGSFDGLFSNVLLARAGTLTI